MSANFHIPKGFIILFSILSFHLSAQMTFVLNEEVASSGKLSLTTPSIYPVVHKDVNINNQTRKAYIVQVDESKPIDSEEVYGDYREISSYYGYTDTGVPNIFVPDELSEEIPKYYNVKRKISTLVENQNNHQLYMMDFNTFELLTNLDKEKRQNGEIIKFVTSLGYKPYTDNGFLFINSKYYMINCNLLLFNKLKADKDYPKKLDSLYLKLEGLRNESAVYNVKFENYIRIYKIQKNRMSKNDVNNWVPLTKSGLTLLKNIVNINDQLWDGIDHYDLKKSNNNIDIFSDYIGVSRNILGL